MVVSSQPPNRYNLSSLDRDDADLMYSLPRINTYGGVKGIGSIVDRSEGEMWMCNWTPMRWLEACRIPTLEEIARDTSVYGPELSEASIKRAEQSTLEMLRRDQQTNPCLYDELAGTPILDKIGCFVAPEQYGQLDSVKASLWVVGGLILGGLVVIKVLR